MIIIASYCYLAANKVCRGMEMLISVRQKILGIICAILFLCCAAVQGANILYLNSYHLDYAWSDTIFDNFSSYLHRNLPESNIYQEYMDTKHFDYERVKDLFKLLLKSKYSTNDIDLVAACDDSAFKFVVEYYSELFDGLPVVFCGVNDYRPEDILRSHNMAGRVTGIIEDHNFKGIYDIASKISPDISKVIFLVDHSLTGVGFRREIEEQFAKEVDVEVEIIDGKDYTYGEMLNRLSKVESGEVVISTACFRDKCDTYVDPHGYFQDISEACSSPIYTTSSLRNFKGPLGGIMIDQGYMGRQFAEMVVELLRGRPVSELPVSHVKVFNKVFDLEKLGELGVALSLLPSGSDFVGEVSYSEIEYDNVPDLMGWEKLWLKEHRAIRVAMFNFPPLMMNGERLSGYCVDYLDLVGDILGVEFEYEVVGSSLNDHNEKAAASGCSVQLLYERGGEQGSDFMTVRSWMKSQYSLFIRKDSGVFWYNGLESLKGMKIAVEEGSAVDVIMSTNYPEVSLLRVGSVSDGLNAVSSGRVSACAVSYLTGVYTARYMGLNDVEVVTTMHELESLSYELGVRKEDFVLAGILKKAFDKIPASEIEELRRKYRIEQITSDGMSYLEFISSLLVIVFVLFIVMVWLVYRLRRKERQARSEEENLHMIITSIADGLIFTDMDGKIVRMNSTAEELTGWRGNEAVGQGLLDVFAYSDKESQVLLNNPLLMLKANVREVLYGTGALQSKDGSKYQVSLSGSVISGSAVVSQGVVLVFRDITREYEVREKLKQVERERQLILDNITVGVCFLDRNMRLIRMNKQMEIFYGKKECDMVGQKCYQGWFGRNKECDDCVAIEAAHTREVCRGKSSPYNTKINCDVVCVPVIEDGELTGILEILFDISEYDQIRTDIEKAYSELKQHSDKLEKQVESRTEELNKSNAEIDQALRELQAAQSQLILSEKMAALGQLIAGIAHEINTPLGAIGSSGEIISYGLLSVIDYMSSLSKWTEGEHAELVNELLEMSLVYTAESMLSTRESRQIRRKLESELTEAGFADSDDLARFMVDMNIYDNWKKYQAIFVDKERASILHSVSKIMDVMHSCNTISTAVVKASRIVRALKNYIHAGSSEDEKDVFRPVELSNDLETVLTLFHNKIKNDVELELGLDEVPEIMGVSDELNQVWTNLIQNSLYAMGGTGRLAIRLYESDGGVEVSIADSGCGMSEEVMARMFEPLYTTKPSGEGTGLGMDIVRRIIEGNHKGRIKVESEKGKGTKVCVWLPLSEGRDSKNVSAEQSGGEV